MRGSLTLPSFSQPRKKAWSTLVPCGEPVKVEHPPSAPPPPPAASLLPSLHQECPPEADLPTPAACLLVEHPVKSQAGPQHVDRLADPPPGFLTVPKGMGREPKVHQREMLAAPSFQKVQKMHRVLSLKLHLRKNRT